MVNIWNQSRDCFFPSFLDDLYYNAQADCNFKVLLWYKLWAYILTA